MAHTKAKGASKLGRDSKAKRLGVKLFGGQKVKAGQIVVRQRGTKWHLGEGVDKGGDDTIFALKDGIVVFSRRKKFTLRGRPRSKTLVSVNSL
ncbi:50S ribosomal protein L27 [Candidatus Berkelbacteria bacterium]|nr:50S ribosomal protein L27 [Candidatus Berkelbacteria bacterium]MBI2588497.1 50S ribosomal protein L27 [Candidatus Berkelbacteria bacterium]MBI4029606.1 50S ribosomal protein L27 [Candidatus Berkelbacteria bacterium]